MKLKQWQNIFQMIANANSIVQFVRMVLLIIQILFVMKLYSYLILNKDQNHYYHNIFLEKYLYQLAKK